MTTNGRNAQDMHRMPAAAPAARLASGVGTSAAEWHIIPCSYVAPVFTDTKLHARRLSEASP